MTCESCYNCLNVELFLVEDREEIHDGSNVAADNTNHVDNEPGHQ